jgi:hypothetical protein
MAKITSFIKDKIYLIQSGSKSILIHAEQDDWNFGIDSEKNKALSAKEMLDILKEPIIEDSEDVNEDHRSLLQDIILKNPKALNLVYGGKFGDLLPVKFIKNLKDAIKQQKIDKEKAKDNWEFFLQKYEEYKKLGIDPENNKDAREYLDSILQGRPLSKTKEQLLDTLKYLYKTDPGWIKKLGLEKTFDIQTEKTATFLMNEAPKLLEEFRKIGDIDWKTLPSKDLRELIKSVLRTKRINVDLEDIIVSGPVEGAGQTRSVTFLGNVTNLAEIVRVFGVQRDDMKVTEKIARPPVLPKTSKQKEPKDKSKKEPPPAKIKKPEKLPADDWQIGD